MSQSCPICKGPLASVPGTQMNPGDPAYGVTVYCPTQGCSMQDWGHGKTELGALDVFLQKATVKKLPKEIE